MITYLSLIIGELVPKRIGLNNPETIASWVARPMMWLSRAGSPAVALLTASTNLVLRVFGIKGEAEQHLTEDELKALISQGAETGAVGATEENIVQRVFQLGDQRVAAIMTPRPDIEWIDVDAIGRRAARLPGVPCAHAVRGVPRRPRQRARHRALGRPVAAGLQGRGRSSSAR